MPAINGGISIFGNSLGIHSLIQAVLAGRGFSLPSWTVLQ